jgi:hypothetical protein
MSITEKAVSTAQQKFMGMVHAYKKGDVQGASPEVKKAAGSLSGTEAEKFASTKHNGLPSHVADESLDVAQVLETIAKYNEYGNAFKRNSSLRKVAEELSHIAELAEHSIMSEADDWYDGYTLRRNMKELKGYAADFSKYANEADMLEQRVQALYDDMGRILERYFELPEIANGLPHTEEPSDPGKNQMPDDSAQSNVMGGIVKGGLNIESKEIKKEANMHTSRPRNKALPPVRKTLVTGDRHMNRVDELTVRAIRSVHENLKRKNPEYAQRFRKLPPKQMIEMVWKLVR